MDFTPITTKEAFDAAVADVLQKEREKYADYADLKAKNAGYEKQIGEMTRAAEAAGKHSAAQEQALNELNAKLKTYETGALKTRIAHETGLPYEMATRLTGETEEDLRRDAGDLLRLMRPQQPAPPLASNEPAGAGDTAEHAAMRAFTGQLLRSE